MFLCRTTVRTCPFVSHAVSLDVQQAVQQSTAEKPTHQQPTIPPCVYNNSSYSNTIAEKKRKRRDGKIQLTLRLSRIERSTVEPTENVEITCRLPESNFEKLSRVAATPVLSTGIARAAVWVGPGAVARSRGIGEHPGADGAEKTYFNSIKPSCQ